MPSEAAAAADDEGDAAVEDDEGEADLALFIPTTTLEVVESPC